MPAGDLAQNLTGHLGFQDSGWHWPLLLTPNLAWTHGTSIAMTDSNPLISLLAKSIAGFTGGRVALRGFGCRPVRRPWLPPPWLPASGVVVSRRPHQSLRAVPAAFRTGRNAPHAWRGAAKARTMAGYRHAAIGCCPVSSVSVCVCRCGLLCAGVRGRAGQAKRCPHLVGLLRRGNQRTGDALLAAEREVGRSRPGVH